jgi:predicted enzyme related to lactoylglutathione lyase
MATDSHTKGTSLSRLLGAGIGVAFLLYNLWSFREHYLLKHSAATVQGIVARTSVMRRKGGIAYNVDYGFDAAGKHYEGEGQISSSAYLKLRPGGPIAIRYVSSDPTISETSEMSHDNVSLFLIGFLGIPAGLIILGVNLRGERLPKQYAQFGDPSLSLDPFPEGASVELPNGISGIAFTMYPVIDMKRARKFYEEELGLKVAQNYADQWIEYYLWDNCFAITTKAGPGLKPSAEAGGSIAFEVNNVDAFVDQLRKKGIQIKVEPFSTRVCRMAVVIDPEGNALTLHNRKA